MMPSQIDSDRAEAQQARVNAAMRAYRQLFVDHPAGRLVLQDLLSAGGILSVSTVEGCAIASAFNDGKRALALHVLQRLRWNEMTIARMAQSTDIDKFDPLAGDYDPLAGEIDGQTALGGL